MIRTDQSLPMHHGNGSHLPKAAQSGPVFSQACLNVTAAVRCTDLAVPGLHGIDEGNLFSGREVGTLDDLEASTCLMEVFQSINSYASLRDVIRKNEVHQIVEFTSKPGARVTCSVETSPPLNKISATPRIETYFHKFEFWHPFRLTPESFFRFSIDGSRPRAFTLKRSVSENSAQLWGGFSPTQGPVEGGAAMYLSGQCVQDDSIASHVLEADLKEKWVCALSASFVALCRGHSTRANSADQKSGSYSLVDDQRLLDYVASRGAKGVLLIHPPLRRQSIATHIVSKMVREEHDLEDPAIPIFTLPLCTMQAYIPELAIEIGSYENALRDNKVSKMKFSVGDSSCVPVLVKSRNVVAEVTRPDRPVPLNDDRDVIILSCHFDHLGRDVDNGQSNEREQGLFIDVHEDEVERVYEGWCDDWSGTSVVMELAAEATTKWANAVQDLTSEIEKESDGMSKRLVFVLFSGEELGCYGSKAFVEDHPALIDKTVLNITLDCIGRQGPLFVDAAENDVLIDRLFESELSKTNILEVRRVSELYTKSDAGSFAAELVPSVLLTNGHFDEYHTTRDDQSVIHLPSFKEQIRLVSRAIDWAKHNASPSLERNPGYSKDVSLRSGLTIDGTSWGPGVIVKKVSSEFRALFDVPEDSVIVGIDKRVGSVTDRFGSFEDAYTHLNLDPRGWAAIRIRTSLGGEEFDSREEVVFNKKLKRQSTSQSGISMSAFEFGTSTINQW